MTNKEKPLLKFDECISKIVRDKLTKAELEIKAINNSMPEVEVMEILRRINTLVSFACGTDNALYDEWRYRFIIDDRGAYWIIQGRELDVDSRDRSNSKII